LKKEGGKKRRKGSEKKEGKKIGNTEKLAKCKTPDSSVT